MPLIFTLQQCLIMSVLDCKWDCKVNYTNPPRARNAASNSKMLRAPRGNSTHSERFVTGQIFMEPQRTTLSDFLEKVKFFYLHLIIFLRFSDFIFRRFLLWSKKHVVIKKWLFTFFLLCSRKDTIFIIFFI